MWLYVSFVRTQLRNSMQRENGNSWIETIHGEVRKMLFLELLLKYAGDISVFEE